MESELPKCDACGSYMDNESVGLDHAGTKRDPKWQITHLHCIEDITVKDLDELFLVFGRANGDVQKKIERQLWKRYHPDRNPNDKDAAEAFAQVTEAFGDFRNPSNTSSTKKSRPAQEPYKSNDKDWEAWKEERGFNKPVTAKPTTPLDDLSDFIPENMRGQSKRERDEYADVDTSLSGFKEALTNDAADALKTFDRFFKKLREQ